MMFPRSRTNSKVPFEYNNQKLYEIQQANIFKSRVILANFSTRSVTEEGDMLRSTEE